MAKKVLVLSASPRKGGNSDLLCDQFLQGAKEAGRRLAKGDITGSNACPGLTRWGRTYRGGNFK
jgi:multimeric flavodoxin WrbA